MTNKEIYKKTIGFSVRRLLWDTFAFILIIGISALGFFLAEKVWDRGLIGLFVGLLFGIIVLAIFLKFISYKLKAGQIAMMTRGITEGKLDGNVIEEGKKAVKQRFKTVAAYFVLTRLIKGIFHQLEKGVTRLGSAIGGQTGEAVGSAIGSIIQTIVAYLCDCCLGWVFFRADVHPAQATCEGAVIFFKHGKTFAKNMGRVFGIGLLTFILIVGVIGGIIYFVLWTQKDILASFYAEIADFIARSGATGTIVDILKNPVTIPIVIAAICGISIWGFVHSTFIKPYVLVGVLRNYIESGKKDVPDKASFAALDAKSPKFRKLHEEIR